jgi:hypothetical protein
MTPIVLSMLAIGFTSNASTQQVETTNQESAEATSAHKHFAYDVFFGSTKIGKIDRDERKNDDRYYLSLSADLSFLFLSLGGYQNSTAIWEEENQWFKSVKLERRTDGFDSKKINVNFSEDAHSTKVEFEGKTTNYQEPKGMITEINAMFLQVRHGLINGKKQFDFYMQTSEDVDHHFFEVKAEEVIDTKFGKLNTYRIDQIKVKNRALSVWYAPDLDMQMVKFHYERKIVDITGELNSYYLK